jgi:hypothetical protein
LDRLPRSKSANLYASYTTFEKQFGDRAGIETTVLGKRRIQYEEEISHEPLNYDTWFDYARLEEEAYRTAVAEETGVEAQEAKVREVYERALAQVPPSTEKRHWRRYIYLFINYALFEEIETKVRSFHSTRRSFVKALRTGLQSSARHIQGSDQAPTQQAIHLCQGLAQLCPIRTPQVGR